MFLPRRLDKFVRDASAHCLKEIRRALSEGRVEVDGPHGTSRPRDGNHLVFEDDTIVLDGQNLQPCTEFNTFIFNKPPSVTTTTRDPKGRQDLSKWLSQMPRGVFPVGRLDRATTGALLFTDDGALASAILQPEHETAKIYWLWLNESLADSDDRLEAWKLGIPLLKTTVHAVQTQVLHQTPDYTELLIELHEGKNRQIRRMCRAVDFRLLHLHRRSIGPLDIRALPLGEFRQLERIEVDTLWASAGGRERIVSLQMQGLFSQARKLRRKGTPNERLEEWLAKPKMERPPMKKSHSKKGAASFAGPLA